MVEIYRPFLNFPNLFNPINTGNLLLIQRNEPCMYVFILNCFSMVSANVLEHINLAAIRMFFKSAHSQTGIFTSYLQVYVSYV